MSLLAELKRRNVIRMAGLYLVGAWLVTQVASTLLPMFGAPDWLPRAIVILLAIGFVPTLTFSWIYELTPDGLKRDADVPREQSISHVTGRRIDFAIIAVLLVALGYFAVDKFVLAPRLATLGSTPSTQPGDSIVVLPFVDMSQARDQEYFSDGIAEELLNLLAKIPDLRVISRSSAFSYKGRNVDVGTIAKQLGVAHVLEGSVRKAGNQVRVTVQLIDARSDAHLWSETYDRSMDDIFAIQDQVAAAVVDQLKLKLLGAAPKARVTKPEALALALQAREQYRLGTRASLEHSIQLYQQALQLAPDYADAWTELAYAYMFQAGRVMRPVAEVVPKARAATERALAIAPEDALAHSCVGWIAMFDRDFPSAASHLERALRLAPRSPEVLRPSAQFAMVLGRDEQALEIARRALRDDPDNSTIWVMVGRVQRAARRYDEAIASYRKVLELAPALSGAHQYLTQTYLMRAHGQADLDAAHAEAIAEQDEAYRLIALALAEWGLGHKAESDAATAELERKYEHDSPYNLAYIYAYRHDADRVFAWLDKAIEYNDTGMHEVGRLPMFDPVREDPRWQRLMERLGRTPEQHAAIRFDVPRTEAPESRPAAVP